MAGIRGKSFTVATLTAAGVKRISLATIDNSLATPDLNVFLRG
jgi:hypothetical protein